MEYRYSSTLSLALALHGDGWLTPRPGRFTPRKETRYPLRRRLDGQHGRFGWVRKVTISPGFDPLGFLAHNESLYRQSYPGPLTKYCQPLSLQQRQAIQNSCSPRLGKTNNDASNAVAVSCAAVLNPSIRFHLLSLEAEKSNLSTT